ACMSSKIVITMQKGVRWIGWKVSEEEWVKLNMDGCFCSRVVGSAGGFEAF
ncbi:hypothetical protein A2U01_0072167, partial [Trifolium medium]|nr:hypothetical protein [Trifolium medium]